MNTLNKTTIFDEWLKDLKDPIGKIGILSRIKRAENGNFGDYKLLPDTGGIYEMPFFFKRTVLRAMAIVFIIPKKAKPFTYC